MEEWGGRARRVALRWRKGFCVHQAGVWAWVVQVWQSQDGTFSLAVRSCIHARICVPWGRRWWLHAWREDVTVLGVLAVIAVLVLLAVAALGAVLVMLAGSAGSE
eukprot:211727-Chlamydomonas_euryale.AAC.1